MFDDSRWSQVHHRGLWQSVVESAQRTIMTVETAHYAITHDLCACILDSHSTYLFPTAQRML